MPGDSIFVRRKSWNYTFLKKKRGPGNSGMPGDSTPPCWVWAAACPECRPLIWLQATDKNDKKDKKRHRHAAILTLTGSGVEKMDWLSTHSNFQATLAWWQPLSSSGWSATFLAPSSPGWAWGVPTQTRSTSITGSPSMPSSLPVSHCITLLCQWRIKSSKAFIFYAVS